MSVPPRARARVLPRLLVLALVGVAVWVASQDQSREAMVMLAITLGTPLLAAVRQLRAAETGATGRNKEWHRLVLILLLLGASIGFAIVLPWVSVAVAVGADALVLVCAVTDGFRSSH